VAKRFNTTGPRKNTDTTQIASDPHVVRISTSIVSPGIATIAAGCSRKIAASLSERCDVRCPDLLSSVENAAPLPAWRQDTVGRRVPDFRSGIGARRNFRGALDEPASMLLTLSPTFWLPLQLGNTIADLAPNSIASIAHALQ